MTATALRKPPNSTLFFKSPSGHRRGFFVSEGRGCYPALIINDSTNRHPFYLCGPTASGKTSVALALAQAWGGEIVNGDAFQLYRGIEVLTATPTKKEQADVPHHLYSCVDLAESMDAARYRELTLPVISEIQARGNIPIVVGGSGLYLKFLTHGPAPLPPADPELRAKLGQLSSEELYRRLAALDPEEAERIDRQNPRYLQRALEICLLTGQPVSTQRTNFDHTPSDLQGMVLQWEPAALEQRIRQRSELMLAGGAVEEVASHPNLGTTASRAIGVSEIRSLLREEIGREECLEQLVVSTRRYAKRQRTWFRREKWLQAVDAQQSPEKILAQAKAPSRKRASDSEAT